MGTAKRGDRQIFTIPFTLSEILIMNMYCLKSKMPSSGLFDILIINKYSIHFQKVKQKARPRVIQIGV